MLTTQQSAARPPDWLERERSRISRYDEARAFFEGQQWTGRPKRGETRLTLNYARALIRKVASYTFPSPTTFAAIASTERAGDAAEQALADYLQHASAHELDLALCIEASTIGDAAVKITWDPVKRQPVIGQVDPATLAAWWDPTLPTRLYRIEQHYQLPPAAIAAAAEIDTSALDPDRLYQITEIWTAERWSLTVEGITSIDQANPYGWIPYLVIANERPPRSFWGQSDLTDLYDVCRELNARMSVLSRVLELSGAPIAVLENVDGSEGITVGPGAKWELPEGAKAYLLDLLSGNGVQLHIDYVTQLMRALHDLSETPRTAFGDSGRTLSGAALEVEIQPLVQRVRRKRAAFSRFYTERNARLLDLMERFGGTNLGGIRQTRTIWPPILPTDEETAVRNQVQLVTARISSRKRAAEQLGNDDPEAELAQIQREERQFAGHDGQSSPQQTSNFGNDDRHNDDRDGETNDNG